MATELRGTAAGVEPVLEDQEGTADTTTGMIEAATVAIAMEIADTAKGATETAAGANETERHQSQFKRTFHHIWGTEGRKMLSAQRTGPDSNREGLMDTITTAVGSGVAQRGSAVGPGIETAARPVW